MRRFAIMLAGLALLALNACETPVVIDKHPGYEMPATPGGRMCANQCRDARDYCHKNCDLDVRICTTGVQSRALQDYDAYTRTQFAAHQPIELRPRDFEQLDPCNQTKERCEAECTQSFNSCFSGCGGEITTNSSCHFLCY